MVEGRLEERAVDADFQPSYRRRGVRGGGDGSGQAGWSGAGWAAANGGGRGTEDQFAVVLRGGVLA